MTFPVIEHIDQVLPHIEGRGDFIVAERDGYKAVDYVYTLPDSFDDPVRKDCRGLKFDATGRVLARPLHKFHNVGERPDTQPHVLDFSAPHTITEKLDGSMIHPAIVNGELVLMTRMGRSDVARKAERLLTPHLIKELTSCLAAGQTPIFEFTAPDNRIVVRYEDSELSLLAIRDTVTGDYWREPWLVEAADDMGVALVRGYPSSHSTAEEFLAFARAVTGMEGFVVRFDDGLWVKAKGDDYVLKHKAKDSILQEKNVLAMVLGRQIDDVLPLLEADDRQAIVRYQHDVLAGVDRTADAVASIVEAGRDLDQKAFAVEHLAGVGAQLRSLAFAVRGGADPRAAVTSYLLKNTGSQTAVDAVRGLHGAAWVPLSGGMQ